MQNVGQLPFSLASFVLLMFAAFMLITCPIFLSFCIGTPCITDCVMAELEKLGQKYRVALRHVL